MNRRDGLLAAIGVSVVACSPPAWAQADAAPPATAGELNPLGQERFQIARIVVDRRARSFTVPGRVLALGKPLEYLATTPGGMKAYESLVELDTTGSEFNLACILIGLERDPGPWRRSGPGPLVGPRVATSLAWTDGTTRRRVSAAEALLNPEAGVNPESVEWVYTGAPASDGQARFAADVTGTLIGFVPDPNCVIQSSFGIGLGAYGSVHGHAMLPRAGSTIDLIVEVADAAK